MKLTVGRKGTRGQQMLRVIAAMILLLAGADLAFPQTCGEDNEPLFPQQNAASTFAHTDGSGDPLAHPEPIEDCFCCCSHIVSEGSESPLGKLMIASGADQVVLSRIPLAPVQLLFHPPRLT